MGRLFNFLQAGALAMVFAVMPSTSNYELQDYGFGNGGGTTSTSNYSLEGVAGEQSGDQSSTLNYTVKSGLLETQAANVPDAPTLQNPSDWYNKLTLIIDDGDNPSDTTFAVAISTDNFVTTEYVQSDMTVGPALGIEDYLTYTGWGGGTGTTIVGLQEDTTYTVKVRANSGDFSESGYGPEASETTSAVSLTFDIDVAASDTETGAPYTLSFGDLLADTVSSSSDKIWFDIETNADSGVRLFLFGLNTGLHSSALTYTIASTSGDLSSSGEGFGVQSASVTQTSGGPLAAVSPYDGAGDIVGIIDASVRQLYTSTSPLIGGRSSVNMKAKVSQNTPAAADYEEVLTIIAAANF